jgi:starvation-inducible DNA-binding protein
MSGPHFRDYHLLLDEHADQLFAMTDPVAERIRKLGGSTLKSIGHSSRGASWITMLTMSNRATCWPSWPRTTKCSPRDLASASLIETWIDETER